MRKPLILLGIAFIALLVMAANPSFQSFNTDQFSQNGNTLSFGPNAKTTNGFFFGDCQFQFTSSWVASDLNGVHQRILLNNFGSFFGDQNGVTFLQNDGTLTSIGTTLSVLGTVKAADAFGLNVAGTDLILQAGASTGTGRGGAAMLQTSQSGNSGSSPNAFTTRLYYAAHPVTVRTNNTAERICTIPLAANKKMGLRLNYTSMADNGTDYQATSQAIFMSAVNKSGTVTVSMSANPGGIASAVSAGTLVNTATIVANGSTAVDLLVGVNSSLSAPTLNVMWELELNSSDTPQLTPY